MDAEDRKETNESDYWSWALGAIITALVITVIACSPLQTQQIPGNFVDESMKGVSAILPFPTCNIKESAKGEIEVSIRLFMHEHFLYTAVRVMAKFSSAINYRIMDQNSFKTDGNNALFGEAINVMHQRILIRRLNSTTHSLDTVLEHRDFVEQLDKYKCACSSALSDWSFISLKFITFDADKSLPADKVAHIKRNSSFDLSVISAISKTGIINATKFTTFTIKNLNCPVAIQVTEIVKLIPPSTDRSTTSDNMDPTFVDKIMCWTGANSAETCQFKNAIEPGPDNCRHVAALVKNVEDRFIPETIISAFFCH